MKNLNGTLKIIGFILIALQLFSVICVSVADVGLYPDGSALDYVDEYKPTELNFQMVLYAATAGVDRLACSIEELFAVTDDPYAHVENSGLTTSQIASARAREALGCSHGKSVGLVIYDIILTISYCAVGVLGVVLVLIPKKRHHGKHNHHHHSE